MGMNCKAIESAPQLKTNQMGPDSNTITNCANNTSVITFKYKHIGHHQLSSESQRDP